MDIISVDQSTFWHIIYFSFERIGKKEQAVTVYKSGNFNANPICKAHHVSTVEKKPPIL